MPYRPVTLTEFVDMYNFGPSHMLWAVRNSLVAHRDHNLEDSPSAAALKALKPKLEEHIKARSKVQTAENRPTNPLLVQADRQVDVTYSRFVRRIRMELDLYAEDSKRGQAALRMLDGPLGMPITSVIHVDRVEQEGLLKNIIRHVETNLAEEVKLLELTSHFELLKEQVDEFIKLMTLDSKRQRLPSRSELEEVRKELQAEMNGCMFQIFAAFPGLKEEDLEMRTALLGPFAIQNDRIAEHFRRRRGGGSNIPPAADDDTGELLVDVDEPASPVADEPEPAYL